MSRTSTDQPRHIRPSKSPGECVSVNQLESFTLEVVAHLNGTLTKHWYRYATVFVDHYSNLSYVHHHEKITTEATIQSKHALEAYARSIGVNKIQHYHCDNGKFANYCEEARQTYTFCSTDGRHQNGRAEIIRDEDNFDLCGVKVANCCVYKALAIPDGNSPLRHFSRVAVSSFLMDFHGLHGPVVAYALQDGLALVSG